MTSRKGPFVREIESVAHSLAGEMVGGVERLRAANGPVPAFAVEHSPEEIAQRELPLWFVRGNATGQVAADFWNAKIDAPNDADPEFAGPVAADAYARQMEALWKNPKHRAAALDSMAPELKQELAGLIRSGQHPGYARSLRDGKEIALDEPGTLSEYLTGRGG